MSSDDTFEDQLRLEFSMLDVPAPSAGDFEKAVRRFRRWRLRRRLLVATPGVAVAASFGVALGLSGVSGPGPGRSSSSHAYHLSIHDGIRLANYTFPLPSGFHVTASVTQACQAVVRFAERFNSTAGISAETLLKDTGTWSYTTVKIASAASANGGCVRMALTGLFTPTVVTGDPSYLLTESSSSRRVDVAGHIGWLTTRQTNDGQPVLQLTVELPQADGRMRDLGVGSSGLNANELLAIVSQGLS